MPLIIVGSVGLLGSTFIFGGQNNTGTVSTSIIGWLAWLSNAVKVNSGKGGESLWQLQGNWVHGANIGKHLFSYIEVASMGSFAFYTAFFIGWRWAVLHKAKNSVLAGATSIASFLIVTHADKRFFGVPGLFVAIVISFLSAWLFVIFERCEKIKIKMPKSAPDSVANGFNVLFPILFVLLIISSINVISYCIGNYGVKEYLDRNNLVWNLELAGKKLEHGTYGFAGLFFVFVSSPFIKFASRSDAGLGIGLVYIFANSLIWWFGIHGGSVLNGVFFPVWMALSQQNYTSFLEHGDKFSDKLNVVNWAFFETYAMTTGGAITGGLVIATWIFARKNKKFMQINKIAVPAAIFNMCEPVTFGYPLVMDPILGIAAIFPMPIATLYAWIFVGPLGWVPKSYIYVPWTMPIGLGAFLSTGFSWQALVLSLSVLPLITAFYTPFVLMKNKFDALVEMKGTKPSVKMSTEESEDIFKSAKE